MELGTQIRPWLGLPPGPWPPDHYALLGLAPGAGYFGEIEARVLDRMELLRAHQLRHPEAVTEGMNRLAQALVCLTDPVARAAYDRGLGIAPAPFEVVEDDPAEPVAEQTISETAPREEQPYEVVEPESRRGGTLPYEVVPEEPEDLPFAEVLPVAEVVPDAPQKPARGARKPEKLKRRTIYRRLAALRRAIRAWEALRPVLGAPGEALATPVAVLMFLRALSDARTALPGVGFVFAGDNHPGAVVTALVRLPSALAVVRGLLPSQRLAVARDWEHVSALLRRERGALRARARRPRRGRRTGVGILRLVRATPELLLVLLAVLLLIGTALQRNR